MIVADFRFKIMIFHYTRKPASKLWVTPRIFAKRNNLFVVNINISILILMVSDQ